MADPPPSIDLSHSEILVVDDVRFTRLTIVKMLTQLGAASIHEAENGRAALSLLAARGGTITCVFTDLEMPVLDGIGLLKAIRMGTEGIRRDTRVIFLTGHSDLGRLGPALLLDLDAFLTKPVSQQTIAGCLRRLKASEETVEDAAVYRDVDVTRPEFGAGEEAPAAPPQGRERCVPLFSVPAGAVLARDLLFENGRLLLRAGTRLHRRLLDRLQELAQLSGAARDVWIAE